MIVEVIIILLLIILNGIFSMSEIALISSRKSKLEMQADDGNEKAKAALNLANKPDTFLSTVQVGITLIGILTGVFGGASMAERLSAYFVEVDFFPNQSQTIAMAIVVIVITYLSLVIGELLPKRIGLSNPEGIASFVARPMTILSKMVSPAVWLLSKSTLALSKLLRIKSRPDNFVTEEEIRSMIEQASDMGEVEREEHEIVERAFFLGDADVGSLMTPRKDIVALDINDSVEKNKSIISNAVHTNFLVFDDQLDTVVGVLNLKKFVKVALESSLTDLKALVTPPLYVTEKTKAFKLLASMKHSQTHFAIAVNEFGTITGIVTMNDLFKVLVGNLYNANSDSEIVRREDGTYLVDGLISLDEFFEFFNIEDTEEIYNKGFFTLGGLVLLVAKNIPKASEVFTWRNMTFEIIDMDGARVDKVLVKIG